MASFNDDDAPIIGIDLGTTYSCVSAFDPETQKVKILPNSVGELTAYDLTKGRITYRTK